MRTLADARRRTGLLVIALVAVAASACARYVPRDSTEASVRHELSRVEEWGHPARVLWREKAGPRAPFAAPEADCPPRVTCIVVTPEEFRVVPSPEDQALLTPEIVTGLDRAVVAPYQRMRDYDGALRSAARWYIDIVEHAEHRRLRPPPAPILGPDPLNGVPNTYNTAWIGIPLSLVITLAGLVLRIGRSQVRIHE